MYLFLRTNTCKCIPEMFGARSQDTSAEEDDDFDIERVVLRDSYEEVIPPQSVSCTLRSDLIRGSLQTQQGGDDDGEGQARSLVSRMRNQRPTETRRITSKERLTSKYEVHSRSTARCCTNSMHESSLLF